MYPVTLLLVGAGSRGSTYASYAENHPDRARVVGVAEPRDHYRDTVAAKHAIQPERVYTDWRQAASAPKFADAVVIATQDRLHEEPAVAFAAKGYHMMLEKPMAPTPEACRRIVGAVKAANIVFAVCHVMRYTSYTRKLKELINTGLIGDVVSVQHLEPVGYWHQAHSFVRGNWRNENDSSFMLLAKSCHDIDWLRYIVGAPLRKVQSFGSLQHFRAEAKPEGAGERCVDCRVEPTCPYSALKIYLTRVKQGQTGWPVDVLTPNPTLETVTEALQTGPYGRCVYACDNDVVDNQVVNMLFDGGRTASFTMTAFNPGGGRRTCVFGTRGMLEGDSSRIEHSDFLTDARTTIDTAASDASILGGHGGGDQGLMQSFVTAVADGDASSILSGPDETLETHLAVFAAEQSRRENRVVDVVI